MLLHPLPPFPFSSLASGDSIRSTIFLLAFFFLIVCDFGLSQIKPHGQSLKDVDSAKGTPLWMAPEVMQFKEFNEKCDVYSFGIVLWEILTRQEPFPHHTNFEKFRHAVCVAVRVLLPSPLIPSPKSY